ncbi:MAG: hypothetical protein IKJ63_03685 [Clostridia bacterium]|nr:hypothetical protein [Clostridia bacterium]MBR2413344.1 hypothetical protein [Clostridia bacterium]MBR3954557.1 hypothetical protein [Clostridia bacterium]
MKKPIKILTAATCIWAVYMLLLFIFLSLCVEFQWTFIHNLPAALDWFLSNVLILLYQAGRFGVPVLTVSIAVLTTIHCAKEKSIKDVDLPMIGTTVVFAITASIISAIDSGTIQTFANR